MLKNISNLGKTLNKAEKQVINGGRFVGCANLSGCHPLSGIGSLGGSCGVFFPTYNAYCSNGTIQNGQCCF